MSLGLHLAKVRLSERKAKKISLFLCFAEREYLRNKVAEIRLSERKAKENLGFFFVLHFQVLGIDGS